MSYTKEQIKEAIKESEKLPKPIKWLFDLGMSGYLSMFELKNK